METDCQDGSQRRRFLGALLAPGAAALFPDAVVSAVCSNVLAPEFDKPCHTECIGFATTARFHEGNYRLVLLNESGKFNRSMALPDRGHGVATHPPNSCIVVFARRPGLYMACFDLRQSGDARVVNAVDGRHFYGHGAFSDDGRWLYATENDFDRARGVIGVYDAANQYRRVREFSSGGTGPHDLLYLRGANVLAVANGGIATHPQHDREKLNLDTMSPSIALIDALNGRTLAQLKLHEEHHQVSLRHLAFDGVDRLWFAGQYEGMDGVSPSLAGFLSLSGSLDCHGTVPNNDSLQTVVMPDHIANTHANYLSSVAVSSNLVAFSASHSGWVLVYDSLAGVWKAPQRMADCSGVASSYGPEKGTAEQVVRKNGFLLTSGFGNVSRLRSGPIEEIAVHDCQYDNHIFNVD